MMLRCFRLGFLPFPDAFALLDGFVANLYTCTSVGQIPSYGSTQFVDGFGDVATDAKSTIDLDVDDHLEWQLWSLDYLLDATSSGCNVHAGEPPFPCVFCNGYGAPHPTPSSNVPEPSHPKPRARTSSSSRRSRVQISSSFLTYAVVVATLQLFLHLTRVDANVLLLPMLPRQAARAVLALANAAGVLGSAVATRRYGGEAACAVSAALIVFCQVVVPAMVGARAGLSGGGGGTSTTTTCQTTALACAVSCGVGWAWGALFWASPGPGEGIRSAGPSAALGFAQMHCSLLTLRRLRHAALAYYAARIWS